MADPVVYGAAYSVYVRAVRMALAEKGVAYLLQEIDVFAPGGPPPEHLARHPFGKIPAFEHDGFRLYETGAITRYVDEAFVGPPLQPPGARARARMNQALGVLDSYAYRALVWGVYVPRTRPDPDEAAIAAVLPKAETCLAALEAVTPAPWLAGDTLTLADLHAAPMFALFLRTPEGKAMLPEQPRLAAWWDAVRARSSFDATRSM